MCGIFGKLFFEKTKIEEKNYKDCLDAISHRGPDDEGFYVDENIILGSKRLAIIDLSEAGHMPMKNEDGRFWIVFNGEIYNFLELRKNLEKRHKFKSRTDSEVLLHLYEEKGVNCLKYLRGMFAFAIWDKKEKILFLARDRLGKKPLKYYFNDKFFIFASELKAILKDREVKREIDWGAIDEYLTYQYVPHPKTGFKGIFKLEPAHYLLIALNGKIKKERYWNLDYSQKLNLSENEWIEAIEEKLKESVKIRLISDVPLGAHLSGGIDSSMIVAMMAQEMKEPVKTFSIGFKEKEYDETKYARLVAKRYGTDHHELIVEPNAIEILPKLVYHYEEPYADSSALPTWYLCQMTKNYITVALNGDGGDENFAGYDRYNAFKLYKDLEFLPGKKFLGKVNEILYQITKLKIFRKGFRFLSAYQEDPISFYLRLIGFFQDEEKEKLYQPDLKKLIEDLRGSNFLREIFKKTKGPWLDRILYLDINSYLPDDLLVKVDIASMAHSLEVRSPFLDHAFMELCAKIPSNLKVKGHNKKYIFKKLALKYIPKECIFRPKTGFGVPLEFWFKNELLNFLKERILSQEFLNYGFNRNFLEQLIKEHQKGIRNHAYRLWALLILEEWLKIFFRS
jgi:asparagine synthase (glutamine-hydrolysing)